MTGCSSRASFKPMAAGMAKPIPMAAEMKPKGRRAGIKASSAGRDERDSSTTVAFSGRRGARSWKTCAARSGIGRVLRNMMYKSHGDGNFQYSDWLYVEVPTGRCRVRW